MHYTTNNLFIALFRGYLLTNAETWKAAQAFLALALGFAPLAQSLFPGYELDSELADGLQLAIASIIAYLTPATTGKIGI